LPLGDPIECDKLDRAERYANENCAYRTVAIKNTFSDARKSWDFAEPLIRKSEKRQNRRNCMRIHGLALFSMLTLFTASAFANICSHPARLRALAEKTNYREAARELFCNRVSTCSLTKEQIVSDVSAFCTHDSKGENGIRVAIRVKPDIMSNAYSDYVATFDLNGNLLTQGFYMSDGH
jgi:hypothetical protein